MINQSFFFQPIENIDQVAVAMETGNGNFDLQFQLEDGLDDQLLQVTNQVLFTLFYDNYIHRFK